MKINLSKILKFCLIISINIFFIFILQYYLNMQDAFSKFNSDLKISLFVAKDSDVEKDYIIEKLSSYKSFDTLEYIDSSSFEKLVEINPELKDVVPEETVLLPNIVLLNNISVNSYEKLEELRNNLLELDFVQDVIYDVKAYNIFFKYKNLFEEYKKIFKIIFFVILFIFILKFLFFILKSLYKDILFEVVYGIVEAFIAYTIICLFLVFEQNTIFILNWHILYFIVPLSSMISLITKESNA